MDPTVGESARPIDQQSGRKEIPQATTASAVHRTTIQGTVSNLNPPFNVFNGTVALLTVPGAGNFSDTGVGWTAGAGVECMILTSWPMADKVRDQ
jgi:hypothetical protein